LRKYGQVAGIKIECLKKKRNESGRKQKEIIAGWRNKVRKTVEKTGC
jgi:hypothetical protein